MSNPRAALALLLLATGCPSKSASPPAKSIPADRIAAAGHGLIFDAAGKQIPLDAAILTEIQESMLTVLRASQPRHDDKRVAAIQRAEIFLAKAQPTPEERVVVTNAILAATLLDTAAAVRERYDWRRRTIATYYIRPELLERIRQEVQPIIGDLSFGEVIPGDPNYADDCRSHGVPIPPDWSETDPDWAFQGELEQNLLQPGDYAGVYTYSDPALAGGCIALPRGGGDGAAGIICQSATGHACFWDNIRASDGTGLGWRGRTLVISELQNGSNLSQACPTCHNGSNVFNISPDDETWGKVLRDLPRTSTFTTRITSSSDSHLGRPRYVPITTTRGRTGWENAYPTFEGCNECHETPHGGFPNRPPMPPDCRRSDTDTSDCYWPAVP